jgi:hypothetical protein
LLTHSAKAAHPLTASTTSTQIGFIEAIQSALKGIKLDVEIHGLYFTRIDFPTPVIASDLQAAILSESEVIKLIERNATVFRAETETLRREVIYSLLVRNHCAQI